MNMLRAVLAFALMVAGGHGSSQEPSKKSPQEGELLPAPRPKEQVLPPPQLVMPPGHVLIPYARPHFPQWGTRDVWQFYGVDGTGRFRPRVIHSPYGAYYATNGADYPWTTTRPMLFMPYVVD